MKRLLGVALLVIGTSVIAQTSAGKKELVGKVLQLQQPGIEAVARNLAEQPAAILMQRAGNVMQTRIPPDKREPIAKDIQADVRKYVEETVPLLRERANKLAPTTIGPMLEERFSEDELKQLVAIMESPINRKYQQMGNEMLKALSEKIVADARPVIDPKIKALEASISGRLGLPAQPAPAAARPPARPASN